MSTEHQQYSPENQLEVIRQYAAPRNVEIVQVYSDHGRSGLNIAGRGGLNRLMSGVEQGLADFAALLVYKACTNTFNGRIRKPYSGGRPSGAPSTAATRRLTRNTPRVSIPVIPDGNKAF
jgi:Resolvase, N terminal domain